KNLTIYGPGANQLTVQRSTANGTPKFPIFEIPSNYTANAATISGLTIANGYSAGILNGGTRLTIANCVISGNSSPSAGGGIDCFAPSGTGPTVSILNTRISGNRGTSGGRSSVA